MTLYSTRQLHQQTTIERAILNGIAPNGGLYVPEQIPTLDLKTVCRANMDYATRAHTVLSLFFKSWPLPLLTDICQRAYQHNFRTANCTTISSFGSTHFVELYHGPTFAFKDFALTLLPHLMAESQRRQHQNQHLLILTATSGDTGKAALAGFKNADNIDVVVFYPSDGVSPIQARQMQTQRGDNLLVLAIDGNFDDAQTHVKQLFTDADFIDQLGSFNVSMSSANSINIGRLLPQIVYYVDSYSRLVAAGDIALGDAINVVVPTGNFGNILAGYYAKRMGLPINKLICASNTNDVLTEFIQTGIYNAKRTFHQTMSPSMDILISSNLERLLYHISDGDVAIVNQLMTSLKQTGAYAIDRTMYNRLDDFAAFACDEPTTLKSIANVYRDYDYLIDPHTAVAYCAYQQYIKQTGDDRHTLILSTASPFKFSRSVAKALKIDLGQDDDFKLVKRIAAHTGVHIPDYFATLKDQPVVHTKRIATDNMHASILEFVRKRHD